MCICVRSSLGAVALSVAGAGLAALGAGLKFAIDEAMDSQVAVAGLETVLASTGGAIGLTSDQLQDMAGNLQDVTRFSDEDKRTLKNVIEAMAVRRKLQDITTS